ncbi:MAG: hypothetical protein QM627_03350 [Luteolibacter sp.]
MIRPKSNFMQLLAVAGMIAAGSQLLDAEKSPNAQPVPPSLLPQKTVESHEGQGRTEAVLGLLQLVTEDVVFLH